MSYLVSSRGHALLLDAIPMDGPVVTVEAYSKWYSLFVVRPGPEVEEVPFPESRVMTPYVDHVPNPYVVQTWAKEQGYEIEEMALEMMSGRWHRIRSSEAPNGLEEMTREQVISLYQSEREWREAFQEDARVLLAERDNRETIRHLTGSTILDAVNGLRQALQEHDKEGAAPPLVLGDVRRRLIQAAQRLVRLATRTEES